VAGKPLDPVLLEENPGAVRVGGENLAAHIEMVRRYGVPAVVAINAFPGDAKSEFEAIREVALAAGASDAVVTTHWADGGAGSEALAAAVWEACDEESDFQLLYPDEMSLPDKIETIAVKIYGADGVDFAPAAAQALAEYDRLGYSELPVCMAKTHLSISHDPKLLGRPTGFRVPIREVKLAAGAGFIYPLAGDMRTMPGLPSKPAGNNVDIDENGKAVGLF
jgi:formate--tetrahydrofolate ligase